MSYYDEDGWLDKHSRTILFIVIILALAGFLTVMTDAMLMINDKPDFCEDKDMTLHNIDDTYYCITQQGDMNQVVFHRTGFLWWANTTGVFVR